VEVKYNYEINLISVPLFTTVQDEIVPAVETAIVESLITSSFTECATEGTERQRRSQRNRMMLRRLIEIDLMGLTASPADSVDPNAACNVPDALCFKVEGGMSFYLPNGSSDVSKRTAGVQAAQEIIQNMKNGLYLSAHPEISGLVFISDSIEIGIDNRPPLPISPRSPPPTSSPTSLVAISLAFLVAVFIFLTVLIQSCRRREIYEEDDDNEGATTSSVNLGENSQVSISDISH